MENKKYVSILKAHKTKLLKKECKTPKEFLEIQNKLDEVELELKIVGGD